MFSPQYRWYPPAIFRASLYYGYLGVRKRTVPVRRVRRVLSAPPIWRRRKEHGKNQAWRMEKLGERETDIYIYIEYTHKQISIYIYVYVHCIYIYVILYNYMITIGIYIYDNYIYYIYIWQGTKNSNPLNHPSHQTKCSNPVVTWESTILWNRHVWKVRP